MKVLITGIAGFVGSNLAKYLLEKTNIEIYGLQRNHKDIYRIPKNLVKNVKFHDLRKKLNWKKKFDIIIHMAAMSHVDRSISDPYGAVFDNVVGTYNILEYARITKPKLFIYFSTDEVFGPNEGSVKFKEWDRFNPGSPYSSTKASGEVLSLSYLNTYNVPVIVTHCMNIFGEMQNEEKFIPKAVKLIRNNKTVPIYANKDGTVSGSRSYIHTDDVSNALLFIMANGLVGDKYNIPGARELTNLEVAQIIADRVGKKLKTKFISSDNVRPGNDFSYGISGSKLKSMGWKNSGNFMNKFKKTIDTYIK